MMIQNKYIVVQADLRLDVRLSASCVLMNPPQVNLFWPQLLAFRGAVLSRTSRLVVGLHTAGAAGRIRKQQAPPARVKQQRAASHSEGDWINTTRGQEKPNKGPVNLNPRRKYRKCLHCTFHHRTLGAQLRPCSSPYFPPIPHYTCCQWLCLRGIFRCKRP